MVCELRQHVETPIVELSFRFYQVHDLTVRVSHERVLHRVRCCSALYAAFAVKFILQFYAGSQAGGTHFLARLDVCKLQLCKLAVLMYYFVTQGIIERLLAFLYIFFPCSANVAFMPYRISLVSF